MDIVTENEISRHILDAAIMVHKEIGGPGLLEGYYEAASLVNCGVGEYAYKHRRQSLSYTGEWPLDLHSALICLWMAR